MKQKSWAELFQIARYPGINPYEAKKALEEIERRIALMEDLGLLKEYSWIWTTG